MSIATTDIDSRYKLRGDSRRRAQKRSPENLSLDSEEVNKKLFYDLDLDDAGLLMMANREGYLEYVRRVYNKFEGTIKLSVNDIISQTPFIRQEDFIWPQLFVTTEGYIVFSWVANGTMLRLEQLKDKQLHYKVDLKNLDNHKAYTTTPKDVAELIRLTFEQYEKIKGEVSKSKFDWKNALLNDSTEKS